MRQLYTSTFPSMVQGSSMYLLNLEKDVMSYMLNRIKLLMFVMFIG